MPLSQPEPSGSSLLLLSRCCSIPRVKVNHSTTSNFQFIHSADHDCSIHSLPHLVRIRSAASGKRCRGSLSPSLLLLPPFHPLPFICRLHLPFGDTFPALAICRLAPPPPTSIFLRLRLAFIYHKNTAANPYPVTQAAALPQQHKSPPRNRATTNV